MPHKDKGKCNATNFLLFEMRERSVRQSSGKGLNDTHKLKMIGLNM
jgi:hypothetical protein